MAIKPQLDFDKNLVIDPGFGFTKIAVRDSNGEFQDRIFPSVLANYFANTPGVLDPHTVKVTIRSTTREGIKPNECRLVGNRAKLLQGESGKLYAFRFPKTDPDIIIWTTLAAIAYTIPAGVKECKLHDSWVVSSLQDLSETEALRDAIAGRHIIELEREVNGIAETIKVDVDWTRDKIHVFQEASGAIYYLRDYNLYGFDSLEEENVLYGNVSIGVGTVDFVLQDKNGAINRVSNHALGLSELASSIAKSDQMKARAKNSSITTDKILQSIQEGGVNSRFVYGKGSMGVDFKDIYEIYLKIWQKNIVVEYLNDWHSEIEDIDKIFFYGGGIHIHAFKTKQSFYFPEDHNPQFIDVRGHRIWAEKNLFG
jgi:hypothetical protein